VLSTIEYGFSADVMVWATVFTDPNTEVKMTPSRIASLKVECILQSCSVR